MPSWNPPENQSSCRSFELTGPQKAFVLGFRRLVEAKRAFFRGFGGRSAAQPA
jgi:hypothetical protein